MEADHYAQWRDRCPFPELKTLKPADGKRRVYCECRCHGLHLLVARAAFQSLGGLNEVLRDWGYEDTDLTTRLELSGYARLELDDLVERDHPDTLRVAFHREK